MKTRIRFLPICALCAALVLFMGCSSNPGLLTQPDGAGLNASQQEASSEGDSGHMLWGIWRFSYDPISGEINAVSMRDALIHWNVTDSLLPPDCNDCIKLKVNSITSSMLQVDVTLKNPIAVSGYDVRGILITEDHIFSLSNADAYTNLYDDGGIISLNPFKAFAVSEVQRKFMGGASHTVEFDIAYTSWPANFNHLTYAVDASWPGNCKEPYDINVQTDGQLYDFGGFMDVTVEALDWQDDVSKVAIFSEGVLGGSVLLDKIDGTHWHKTITNGLPAPVGSYVFRVQANSPNGADLSLSDFFDVEIVEGTCEADDNNSVDEAVDFDFGEDTYDIVCLPDDQSDFYKFSVPTGLAISGTIDLSSTVTPTSMKLFDENLELVTSAAISSGHASINAGAFFLLPGDYYIQVLTNNAVDIVPYHLENNMSVFTPDFGPADSPWPVIRHDQRRTGCTDKQIPERLAVKWALDDEIPASGPVIGPDGTLYYTITSPPRLRAVTPDGEHKWFCNLSPTGTIGMDISVGWDGIVYVPDGNSLYAIWPSGSVRWIYNADDPGNYINYAPLIRTDGLLVVADDGHSIKCIKPNNMQNIWSFGIAPTDEIHGMALGDDGYVYITFNGGKLLSLKPDGSLNYTKIGVSSPVRPPVVDESGVMYYVNETGHLIAVPKDGGGNLWDYDMDGAPPGGMTNTPLLSNDGILYAFCSTTGDIDAVDSSTGDEIFAGLTSFGDRCSNLVLDADGYIYTVQWEDGSIDWMDTATGEPVWGYCFFYEFPGLGHGVMRANACGLEIGLLLLLRVSRQCYE